MLVATLISAPTANILDGRTADMAHEASGASKIDWLAEGIACDLHLPEGVDASATEAVIREALADLPIDICVQDTASRRKKLLLADMDSTMIDQECIDELADEVGLKDFVADITRRAMNNEIPFDVALRQRVALLKGLDIAVVDRIIENRITLAKGGLQLVATMRANGAWTALISGGFTLFTSRIAAMLGFDENRANRLIELDGRFSGEVAEPILGREAKAVALREIAAAHGITPDDAIVVGDGANDLDMIRLAGSGIALHAKPVVSAQARLRIDHADLTALLYLQGYRQSEFVG